MQSKRSTLGVLVVGQTPPPYHGQGMMIDMLVKGEYDGLNIYHVRMNFSETLDQIGKVKLGKIIHLFSLILQIYFCKLRYWPQVLYYPPAGPNKVPLIRDAIILFATRPLFRRTVYHFQASGCSELIPKLPSGLRQFVTFAMSRPDIAIELSEHAAPDGEFLKAKKIVRIPNASPDVFEQFSSITSPISRSSDTVRILYLGTMCEEKGAMLLVQACGKLASKHDNFHVDFVGGFQSDDFRQAIEREVERLALSTKITVHGQKTGDAKWQMFAQADLFCFPSHYSSEGFPCVLVEAMSFALPVLSTRWRGIPSIVEDGCTGVLVPPQDVEALAKQLSELLDAPEKRRTMGEAGRKRFADCFTQEKYRSSMREAFLGLANN